MKAKDLFQHFFWNFVRLDNAIYNYDVLDELYNVQKSNASYLTKPKVIVIGSIIECILFDFYKRIKERTEDPLDNVTSATIEYIKKSNKKDELTELITIFENTNLLPTKDRKIYQMLKDVRDARNRVHVQNKHKLEPEKEDQIFNGVSVLINAQNTLIKVVEIMTEKHYRNKNFISDKVYWPWDRK